MVQSIRDKYQLLDYLIEGCQVIDHDYRYIYLNDAVVKHSHFTADYLLGKKMSECYPGIEKSDMYKKLTTCMQFGLPKKMVNQFKYPDGSIGWFELIMQQVPDGVLIMSNDITSFIANEHELALKNNLLRALRSIDIEILRSTPILDIIAQISDTISQHILHIDGIQVLLYNKLCNQMDPFFSKNIDATSIAHDAIEISPEMVTMLKNLHDYQLPIQINKFDDDSFRKRSYLSAYQGHYLIPLISDKTLIGVMEIFQKKFNQLDKHEIAFLIDLGKQTTIAIEKNNLFEDLIVKNQALNNAYEGIIEGWSRALEIRDLETKGHTLRVTDLACEFAKHLNYKDFDYKHFRYGCLMHDLGKIIVPESVLLKPGPLTDEEWLIMQKHPSHAKELLSSIAYLEDSIDIPYCHHEWYDGSGYPQGLSASNIPIVARIFAFADVYDALTSDRVYRKAWSHKDTIDYIVSLKGKQFDPKLTESFITFIEVYNQK